MSPNAVFDEDFEQGCCPDSKARLSRLLTPDGGAQLSLYITAHSLQTMFSPLSSSWSQTCQC